jgi:hypothetical protein
VRFVAESYVPCPDDAIRRRVWGVIRFA